LRRRRQPQQLSTALRPLLLRWLPKHPFALSCCQQLAVTTAPALCLTYL
jgi:hypothetical protein